MEHNRPWELESEREPEDGSCAWLQPPESLDAESNDSVCTSDPERKRVPDRTTQNVNVHHEVAADHVSVACGLMDEESIPGGKEHLAISDDLIDLEEEVPGRKKPCRAEHTGDLRVCQWLNSLYKVRRTRTGESLHLPDCLSSYS